MESKEFENTPEFERFKKAMGVFWQFPKNGLMN
jgi:hypothetical protein